MRHGAIFPFLSLLLSFFFFPSLMADSSAPQDTTASVASPVPATATTSQTGKDADVSQKERRKRKKFDNSIVGN